MISAVKVLSIPDKTREVVEYIISNLIQTRRSHDCMTYTKQLGMIGEQARIAIPTLVIKLRSEISNGHVNYMFCRELIRTLANIANEDDLELIELLECLTDEKNIFPIRYNAQKALIKIGNKSTEKVKVSL